jgi:hypothetical protein
LLFVTTGFWPAILVMSPTAESITFLSETASLTPMFSVIFCRRGTCITEVKPNLAINSGTIFSR